MLKYYIIIILAYLHSLTLAQEITFQKYGVSEGLSSNTVFSTIEDESGFIWISTEEGVDRFDGLNFKHYNLPNLYVYRTANRVLYDLKIDANNQIWLFTLGGLLYRYDTMKDEFVLFHMLKDESDQAAYTFYIDHNNNFWFGMENGILIMNPYTKAFSKISSIKDPISSIIQDNKERYYLGGSNGIAVLDSARHYLYNLLDFNTSKVTGLKNSPITSLYIDEENDMLWVGSNKLGLCTFNLVNFDFNKPKGLSQSKGLIIRGFSRLSAEEIIIAIDGGGLIIWNTEQQRVVQKIIPNDKPDAISSRSVQHIFRNSSGVFFISTFRGGLNVYSPGKLKFQSIEHFPNSENSLSNNVVMALVEISQDVIGFKTDGGISLWDKNKDKWQHLNIELENSKNISNSRDIMVDQKKNIWATSYTDSLVLFKKNEHGIYTSTKNFHKGLSTLRFYKVHAGENGLIWFSNDDQKRISSYSVVTQKIQHYPFAFGNVQTMLNLPSKKLALGTSTGLVIVNTNNGMPDEVDIINESKLKTTMISSLALDENKQLWVGTRYEGLFIVNFYKNTVTRLTSENGLLSNRIFALTAEKDNIWASTSKGISRIDSKNNVSNFTQSDGLISIGFNYNAVLKDVDGQLYFGTSDGAITFDPDDIHPVKPNKSLAFDEFYLNHKLVLAGDDSPLNKPLIDTELIELEHYQNSFSISFTSIDFLHSDQGNYQWKLENFDQEWVSGQGTSIASYTNLNSGKYIFKVRMVGQKGELVADEKQVEVIIHLPFWETLWAFSIYLILGLLLIALIVYSNGLRLNSKHSKERLHFLINMAHEIKTPLMLIKAPLTDLLKNRAIDTTVQQGINIALDNAEKVHKQMLQFLDFRRLNRRKKDLIFDPTDLVQFLKDKVFAFKVLADKKNITLSLDSDKTDLVINIDQKILDTVISNLLSNAIKYTLDRGEVLVQLIVTKKKCKILVKDSGIGIPVSQKKKVFQLFYRTPSAQESGSTGSGVGLVLASDLARLIGGNVTLEGSSSKGSTFSFIFPHIVAFAEQEAIVNRKNNLESQENVNPVDSRIKVLLVEDDDDLREFSKSKLNEKYNVITASNGSVALEVLEKSLPDIVVSDIMMPKMNGRQLCMNLKKNIETCHVPVILLTGLGSKEHIIQGLESGADDYIVKPYDYELLISKIEGLLLNRLVLKSKFLIYDEKEQKIEYANQLDDRFMIEVTQYVEENISDTHLTGKDLCEAMGMSRSSFYHKLKSLIDVSPNEFIRTIRLKKGRSMLLNHSYNVSEVAYNVGFSDAKYFGTLFKKYFGQTPSNFVVERRQRMEQIQE